MWEKRLGRFCCLLALWAALGSDWLWAESSPEPAASSEVSSQSSGSLESLPAAEAVPLDPSTPLVTRLATQLEAWIAWYGKVQSWYLRAQDSWKNLNDSLTKREAEIAALRQENEALKKSLALRPAVFGASGFGVGFAAGFGFGNLVK